MLLAGLSATAEPDSRRGLAHGPCGRKRHRATSLAASPEPEHRSPRRGGTLAVEFPLGADFGITCTCGLVSGAELVPPGLPPRRGSKILAFEFAFGADVNIIRTCVLGRGAKPPVGADTPLRASSLGPPSPSQEGEWNHFAIGTDFYVTCSYVLAAGPNLHLGQTPPWSRTASWPRPELPPTTSQEGVNTWAAKMIARPARKTSPIQTRSKKKVWPRGQNIRASNIKISSDRPVV